MKTNRLFTYLAHLLLFSLGIIGFSKQLSDRLVAASLSQFPNPVSLYLRDFFWYSGKPYELAQYAVSVVFLVTFACIASWILSKEKIQERIEILISNSSKSSRLKYWALSFLVNISVLVIAIKAHDNINTVMVICFSLMLPWTYLMLWPIRDLEMDAKSKENNIAKAAIPVSRSYANFYKLSLLTIIILYVIMLSPFIFRPVKLLNEFWNVTSYSVLDRSPDSLAKDTDRISPVVVDDLKYTTEHKILGPDPMEIGSYVEVPESKAVSLLCKRSSSVEYNHSQGCLCLLEPMKDQEFSNFGNVMQTPKQKIDFESAQIIQESYWKDVSLQIFSPQEKQYIKNNFDMYHIKTLNRWVIHHHSFMLAPMNELKLGRPTSESYFQYGYLNCRLISALCNLISGDISWQAYFPTYYAFYLIYFILVISASWVFFRSWSFVSFMAFGCIASMGIIGYRLTFLGPGMNPLRHLLDLPVAILLWRSFHSSGRIKWIWFILAYMLALLAILCSHEFGVFLGLATVGTFLWSLVLDPEVKVKRLLIPLTGILTVIGLGMAVIAGTVGIEGQGKYYLLGLLGFPTNQYLLIIISALCGVFLLSGLLMTFHFECRRISLMALFFGIYAMQLDTYFIWNHVSDHLLSLLVIHQFAAVFLALAFMHFLKISASVQSLMRVSLTLLSCLIFCSCLINYGLEWHKIDTDFYSHKIFHWSFDRARVDSNMDPEPFQQSLNLIQKNSENDSKIYIISRYDMFLPFLAHKYSAMPFFEIGNFMVTTKEKLEVQEALHKSKPDLIFVDADISKNFRSDIIPSLNPIFGFLHGESFWRAERLEMISEVWNDIKSDYELKETSGLISVWKRKYHG